MSTCAIYFTSGAIKGETKERNSTHETSAAISGHFLIFSFSYMNGERLSCSEANEMLDFSLAKPGSE